MRGKIPVTEGQFFDSVDSWIWRLTGEGSIHGCGFCEAKYEADKKVRIRTLGCKRCLVYELCCSGDSPYDKTAFPDSQEDYEQGILEILEGLYKIGVKLGFYEKSEVTRSGE
jgi:hypothetical protein